jgi:nucleoside-diphosphate-sugar epimerase
MRVFVTGATGFIGSAVVKDLIQAGHQVLGMARSDAGAQALIEAGAQVHRGDLEDLESLRTGAAMANCEMDRCAIEVLGSVLAGSGRPLVVSSGTALIGPGRLVTEDDAPPPNPHFPRVSEQTAVSLVERGVRVSVVRLPQVHDRVKQGLVTYLIAIAREKGISAYAGDGRNRWAAVHVADAAPLYRLALEKGEAGARYHPIGEEGVPLRDIAEAIGRGLKVPVVSQSPEEAAAHFGWLGSFVGLDMPASSALTQQRLGWRLTGQPGMLADLERATAFEA